MNPRTHSRRTVARGTAVVLLILGTSAARAQAQRTDAEWLEGCREQRRGDRETHCVVRTDILEAGVPLRVDAGRNGGVIVRGADRRDVEVHARIQAWSRSAREAETMANAVQLDYAPGSIRAEGPDPGDREGWAVTFVVFVPRRSDLDLQAQNGPVSAESVSGAIQARTQNGPVTLRAVGGDVNARTRNGPITVELTGDRWAGERLDAETQNGPITLRVPDGFNARIEAGTVNGPFHTDIPLPVVLQGPQRSKRIEATLGDGGPLVRAVTRNGPVNIRRME